MSKVFKKNEKYDQKEIANQIRLYHRALELENYDKIQEALTSIFHFSEKYVCKVLWNNYRSLMENPAHRDDLTQEVWVKIFEDMKNYNPEKGGITIFIAPRIKHVVSDYTSGTIYHMNVSY